MRILHIIDSLNLGGAQTVIKGIFEYQVKNDNIFLFVLRKREVNVSVNHPNIIIFDSVKRYSLKSLFELRDLIREEKINILHCHLFKSQFFGYLLKLVWFRNIKLVFHEHGEILQGHLLYNFFIMMSKNLVDNIIAVSEVTADKLSKKVGISRNKIEILYNFINYNKLVKNYSQKKNNIFTIGFIGRLSPEKGCEYLIRSLPYLDFNYRCLIAGDGKEKNRLKYLVNKLGIIQNVEFLGFQKNTDFYSMIDVLVIPSIHESFGIVAIEAQALGIPIIASNIDSLNEIIKDGDDGLLFKTKNGLDLAEKIRIIYGDDNLKNRLVNKSLENIRRYDIDSFIKQLELFYKNIING